jgi:hypothetical protein
MGFEQVVIGDLSSEADKKKLINNFKKLEFIFVKNLTEAIKTIFKI